MCSPKRELPLKPIANENKRRPVEGMGEVGKGRSGPTVNGSWPIAPADNASKCLSHSRVNIARQETQLGALQRARKRHRIGLCPLASSR